MVVGTRLGLEVLGFDLDRDGEGGRGHTHFAQRPRDRDFVERVVTTFMAGFAAEERLGAADPEGSGWDVDLTLREWLGHLEPDRSRRPALAARFHERARRQLSEPGAWADVEAVAEALLQVRRLDGAAVRSLLAARG